MADRDEILAVYEPRRATALEPPREEYVGWWGDGDGGAWPYARAFTAGLIDPLGVPSRTLRAYVDRVPAWASPVSPETAKAYRQKMRSWREERPVAAGAGSAILPGQGIARLGRMTLKESLEGVPLFGVLGAQVGGLYGLLSGAVNRGAREGIAVDEGAPYASGGRAGYAEGGAPAGPPVPPQVEQKDAAAKLLVSEYQDYPMILQEALYRDLMTPKADGGAVDEAAIKSTYTDADLGYGRQPIDPDYQEWRQRALDERYNEDLKSVEVMQGMHNVAGYRPGKRIMTNVEDRRLDGPDQLARHQFIADSLDERMPTYVESYGPLPGPDVELPTIAAAPRSGIMNYLRMLYGR